MGTILLQIAPIHCQATEVTFGARLRLLRPALAFSFESAFAFDLSVWLSKAKPLGSSFGNRAYLPERSVCQCIQFIPKDCPFPINGFELPRFRCAVLQLKPWFLYFLPDDPILKELLDILPDDCLNFDTPEYRVQTSAFSLRRPEGRDEMLPIPTKFPSSSPQFPSSLLSLT